jgi:hypothetical protein
MALSHPSHYGQFENLTHPVGNAYNLSVHFNFFPATPGGFYAMASQKG